MRQTLKYKEKVRKRLTNGFSDRENMSARDRGITLEFQVTEVGKELCRKPK